MISVLYRTAGWSTNTESCENAPMLGHHSRHLRGSGRAREGAGLSSQRDSIIGGKALPKGRYALRSPCAPLLTRHVSCYSKIPYKNCRAFDVRFRRIHPVYDVGNPNTAVGYLVMTIETVRTIETDALRQLLHDADEKVRLRAAGTLLRDCDPDVATQELQVFLRRRKSDSFDFIPLLIEVSEFPDAARSLAAVTLLRHFPTDRVPDLTDTFERLLVSRDFTIRYRAARELLPAHLRAAIVMTVRPIAWDDTYGAHLRALIHSSHEEPTYCVLRFIKMLQSGRYKFLPCH